MSFLVKKNMKNFKDLNKKEITVLIFESVMALFYPIFGIFLLTTNLFQLNLYIKIVFGIIFILYGIYRIYRAYKKLF